MVDSGTTTDDRRPTDELLSAAEHEASEDRRLAALMVEPRNRAVLVRRAMVTEALAAELVSLRGQLEAVTELAEEQLPFAGLSSASESDKALARFAEDLLKLLGGAR